MIKLKLRNQFKRDYKKAKKRGLKEEDLIVVVKQLQARKPLPEKYKDHALKDSKFYKGMRECHINPDWLLIYFYNENQLTLELIRTGTHSDLF